MVSLIFEYPRQAAEARQGEASSLCPAAPFLRVPTRFPTEIRVDVNLDEYPVFAAHSGRIFGSADFDDELSAMATDILGTWFHTAVSVTHTSDGGVYAFIDPHASGVRTFAVGPRIRLLDKYFNAGSFLLWLIERCPLEVWGPSAVQDMCSGVLQGWESEHKMEVWDIPSGEWDGVPKLPPNLTKIVQECLRAHESFEESNDTTGIGEGNLAQTFPIGLAVWDSTVPWQNKKSKRCLRDFGIERGNDISWIALDDLGLYHMETGLHGTCTELFHSIERFTEVLTLTKPFIKLFQYLSHDSEEINYHCSF